MLYGCGDAPRREKAPKLPYQIRAKNSTAPATNIEFCAPNRYPLATGASTDIRKVWDYFGHHPTDGLKGKEWRQLNWDRFTGEDGIDYESNIPGKWQPYSFVVTRTAYCGFLVYVNSEEYDALELYTNNSSTGNFQRLVVSGTTGSGCGPCGDGPDSLLVYAGVTSGRFLRDTLLEISYLRPSQTAAEFRQADGDAGQFTVDSLVSRIAIRADGSFQTIGTDSVRFRRTGNLNSWLQARGFRSE